MACGTPTVLSRISAHLEVAGTNALFFDPTDQLSIGNALVRISKDGQMRARLSEQGLQRAARFDWRSHALSLLDIVDESLCAK
jgi:glycosyltransferase involved in cell wall biosynthesis